MYNRVDIDEMVKELEELLPVWSARYPEAHFVAMLAAASDYICRGAEPQARTYALKRLGVLVPGSGFDAWASRYADDAGQDPG
jgi:hypothetical protein